MRRKNPLEKYLNKIYNITIIGKGKKNNYLGKIDNVVCFIDQKEKSLKYNQEIAVKVIFVTNTCLFSEVV